LKLSTKRKVTQFLALVISNLGFFRILKTGFVCPFLYCHGCPFAAFGCPIGVIQNFIVYGRFPFFAVGSLGVYGMFFGRVFCGWACPFGALHDLLAMGGRRKIRARPYWYVKYVSLFLVIALTWYFLDTVFCKFCPSGSLFAAIPFRILYPGFGAGLFFYIHILTLILTIALALVISRFWCRYICPLGAIAGTFNKLSLLTIQLDKQKCKKCVVCLEECPMGISEPESIGSSTDCILCGKCVEKCPEKALKFTFKAK